MWFFLTVVIAAVLCLHVAFSHESNDHATCGTFLQTSKTNGRLLNSRRDELPFAVVSPAGHFLIHYALDGENAVDSADSNNNNIPDYVDSVAYYYDYALKFETEILGFPVPPLDNGGGGSTLYDIYLIDLSRDRLYGVTIPDNQLSSPNSPRFSTYILMDNNFSPEDKNQSGNSIYYITGINAVKITAAHELHHAIQLGNYGRTTRDAAVYEMTSTWIEWRLFPEIYDYIRSANNFFTKNKSFGFGKNEAEYGYGYAIFAIFATQRYNDSFMKTLWEEIGAGSQPYAAMDKAFVMKGSDISDAWCSFLPWLYHTGYRANGKQYLPNAELFRPLAATVKEQFSPPSFSYSARINAFEILFLRCILTETAQGNTPDTIDFVLTNPDANAIVSGSQEDRSMTFVCAQNIPGNPIDGTELFWNFDMNGALSCSNVFRAGGFATEADLVFPSPFVAGRDELLYFPATASMKTGQRVLLTILTLPVQQQVFSQEVVVFPLEAGGDKKKRVAEWKPPHDMPNGVYLYLLQSEDGSSGLGKFTVKR